MGMSAQREQAFALPWETVWQATLNAIPTVPKMKVGQADPSTGRILVNKGFSMKSWGEDITVDVFQPSPGQSAVRVHSQVKAQLVDWGVNKANVEAIMGAVAGALGVSPQAEQPQPAPPPGPQPPAQQPPAPQPQPPPAPQAPTPPPPPAPQPGVPPQG
jgi:hypothetical protein